MSSARVLYHMVRADFLERVRRYSFLLTLAASLFLGYTVATEKVWIVVGDGYRGVYNSAWIGAVMAVTCSTFLSLIGFYVVKNSVQRDTETRVGEILAATPMRKSFYTLAKTVSNFAVLASMVLILMVSAVLMFLLRSEQHEFSLWKLWSPFLLLALPAMAVTAAIAVLFETLPVLNGGAGNVAYFFVWASGLALSIQLGVADPAGLQLLFSSARAALLPIDSSHQFSFALTVGGQRAVRTFPWNGFAWNLAAVRGRGMWVAVAVGMSLVASLFFHRFDPSRGAWKRRQKMAKAVEKAEAVARTSTMAAAMQLTPLAKTRGSLRFFELVLSELRLMLKGQRWWWNAGAMAIIIGSLASPIADSRGGWLVAAWIWPVLVWSQMGSRDVRCNTEALIFSCEHSLQRQLPALYAAGVVVTALTGSGTGIRLLFIRDWNGLLAWMAAAFFIPSLALALGVWSGGSKAFEALYSVWWYIGPLHHVRGMDFAGTTAVSSTPTVYLIGAGALILSAYIGRRARLGYA